MLGTLGVVETALGALGIAHGRGGVQAAVDFLAEAVPAPVAQPTTDTQLRDAMGA
jgi:alanine-glyoxylate transaminase / serine-glyoxylate transaminase / serine-pyruvate transaminase